LFAYWNWWTQARPILLGDVRFNTDKRMEYALIHNSAIVTSLLAVRKLNEFFKARPKANNERDDDLRAYDYPGFARTGAVINPEDFQEIHKRIGHMTYREVDYGKVTFELYEAVELLLPRCLEFLEYVKKSFYSGAENKRSEIEIIQKGLLAMRQCWKTDQPQQS
ncbi:MAG: hypothetical protein MUF81_12110, partial [Verrucomicrobia bacterium]|nr:hypothetical protein [Verrucomicrobiota bacterium]